MITSTQPHTRPSALSAVAPAPFAPADGAGPLLSRRQSDLLVRRSRGVAEIAAAVLRTLPSGSAVTDRAVDAAFEAASSAVAERMSARHPAAWPALAVRLAGAALLTEPLRELLSSAVAGADAALDELVAAGGAQQEERLGEPVLLIADLAPAPAAALEALSADDHEAWIAAVRAEYDRVGADHELAAGLAGSGEWAQLRAHIRRRYPELLRDPRRLAGLLAALPADEVCGDAWIVVVERLCAEATASPAAPRRVRRPVAAMPPLERCWLQAGRVRLEMADGSFTKAVAEAKSLSRLLEQVDAPDDEAAELWLQSALPLVHTGDHTGAVRRLRGAAALAIAAGRPHVEAQATGLLALSSALRGELGAAAEALDAMPAAADDGWAVAARLAGALVRVEAGLTDQAADLLAAADAAGPDAFWAIRAAIGARVALVRAMADEECADPTAPGRALDDIGLAEQLNARTPASNHDRGLLAAAVALLHLADGRPSSAHAALGGFDDGRETTACARALIDLAESRTKAAAAVVARLDARRLQPVTIVEAAALRALTATDDAGTNAALGRAVAIAGRCGLSRRAELILRMGSR